MRDCNRPLLVFAPGGEDGRFRAQVGALDGESAGMVDRQMLLVPVLANGQGYREPEHAPLVVLPPEEQGGLRRRFGVGTGEFRVVLLGKDGGEKLASGKPVAPETLFGTVDAMPMRQKETRRTQAFGGSRQEGLRRERAREASQQEEVRRERAREELQQERMREAELRREREREQARHK